MAKLKSGTPAETEPTAPIPEDNLPGHHPEVEQDKPMRPPKLPPRYHRSPFRRDEPFATASRVFGVTADNSYVEVHEETLEIRFGPWHLTTTLDNIESVQETGPFQWWKVIGPAHLSLKDRGITFATSAQGGVCLQFRDPLPALEPRGVIQHPGATVTVTDPDALVRFIENAKSVVG